MIYENGIKSAAQQFLEKSINYLLPDSTPTERALKEKSLINIKNTTDTFSKIISSILEYLDFINRYPKTEAIKHIKKHQYGGTFSDNEAANIYKKLNKIVNIYKKNYKKNYSSKPLNKDDVFIGGTGHDKDIVEKGGVASFGERFLAVLGTPLFFVKDVLESIPGGIMNTFRETQPYLNNLKSRKEKIDDIGEFKISIPKMTFQENFLSALTNYFTGPSNDFPTERGGILGIFGAIFLLILISLPLPILGYITNTTVLISALATKRKVLAIIAVIGILTNILIGPLANIFIQMPLYIYYYIDGWKYLEISEYIVIFKKIRICGVHISFFKPTPCINTIGFLLSCFLK